MKSAYRSHLCFFSSGLKESLEKGLKSGQTEEEHLSSVFRELAKCKRKDLKKENILVTKVATIEKRC